MAYGTFKSVEEIAEKFDISVMKRQSFIDQKSFDVPALHFALIEEALRDDTNYVSEYAICETLISPILKIVVKNYALKVWSHIAYDVDKEKGLVGEPDYLIAAQTKYGGLARPALCIIEAKDEQFNKGWTQALAEMTASSLLGATSCYGIVSTGVLWQFGKLENEVFVTDANLISATDNLQRLFNTINWVFNEVSAQAPSPLPS